MAIADQPNFSPNLLLCAGSQELDTARRLIAEQQAALTAAQQSKSAQASIILCSFKILQQYPQSLQRLCLNGTWIPAGL